MHTQPTIPSVQSATRKRGKRALEMESKCSRHETCKEPLRTCYATIWQSDVTLAKMGATNHYRAPSSLTDSLSQPTQCRWQNSARFPNFRSEGQTVFGDS